VIDHAFGWRTTFLIFALLGAGIFVLAWGDLGETNQEKSETMMKQFRAYPQLLGSQIFWGHVACQVFSVGAFYTFLAGAPLIGEVAFGLSPAQVGIGLGAISGGFVFGNFLTGRFAKGYSLGFMMVLGRVVAVTGVVAGLALFGLGVFHPVVLFGAVVFVGVGNGLTLPASNVGAMSVRPKLAGSAAGLSGAAVVAGGAVITFGTGAVLSAASNVFVLLGILLAVCLLGLASAVYVWVIDRPQLVE
jgi:predicted MFS family arabinose efflux permease